MERENKMALKLLPLKEKLIKLELSVKDDDVLFNQFAILSTDFKEYNKLVIAKNQKSEDFGRDLNDRTNLFIDNHWEELRKRIVFEKKHVEKPDEKARTETIRNSDNQLIKNRIPYFLIWILISAISFALGVFSQHQYHFIMEKSENSSAITASKDTNNKISNEQIPSSAKTNPISNKKKLKIREVGGHEKIPLPKTIVISIAELAGGAKLEKVSNEIVSIKDQIKNINKYDIKFSTNENDATYRLSIAFSEGNQKVDYELVQIKTDSVICSSGSPKSLDQVKIELVKCLKIDNL